MLPHLASCASNGHETSEVIERIIDRPVIVDTACKWVKPIYVSRQDEFSDETARAILAHNKSVVANCGMPKK